MIDEKQLLALPEQARNIIIRLSKVPFMHSERESLMILFYILIEFNIEKAKKEYGINMYWKTAPTEEGMMALRYIEGMQRIYGDIKELLLNDNQIREMDEKSRTLNGKKNVLQTIKHFFITKINLLWTKI